MDNRSCHTNLISFFDDIRTLVDKGNRVGVMYVDSCKAFHSVSHDILIKKNKHYTIS